MLCYFLSWVVCLVSLNLMLEYVTMCDQGSHSQVMLNIFKMELLWVRSFLASCLQILDTIRRLQTSHYFHWNSHPFGLWELWECSFSLRKWPVLRCSLTARHNKLSCCLTWFIILEKKATKCFIHKTQMWDSQVRVSEL